jgi:hypothetical protein
MVRNVQSRKSKCIAGLLAGGIASVLLVGCPDPGAVVGVTSGCQREFGVKGVDRPETSGLSCAAIDKLTSEMPSEPEAFLTTSDSPRLLWKCRFYGTDVERILLHCEHNARHFSLVKKPG